MSDLNESLGVGLVLVGAGWVLRSDLVGVLGLVCCGLALLGYLVRQRWLVRAAALLLGSSSGMRRRSTANPA